MTAKLRIVPEPTPDEREAIERVLADDTETEPYAYRSAWRLSGLPAYEDAPPALERLA